MDTQSSEPYRRLMALLGREEALYRVLLSLLEKERRAIVESDLSRLGTTVKKKEDLLQDIRNTGRQRELLITDLARELGCPAEDLTISRLSELAGEPCSTRLKRFSTVIAPLVKAVQDLNTANSALVRHSVDLIRGSLSFLNNLIRGNAVYYRTGRVEHYNQGGKILCSRV